jgi:hypothetical protein
VALARAEEDALVGKAQTFVSREVSAGVDTAGGIGGGRTRVCWRSVVGDALHSSDGAE